LAIIDSNPKNPSFDNKRLIDPRKTVTSKTIDEIDQKIADKLASNGRITIESLAKEIGITAEKARRKIERLKDSGVLKITIQLNVRKLGYHALCIFFTTIRNENLFPIIDSIGKIPDVISIMKTTGDYDLQIYAMVKDLDHMLKIEEAIGNIQGISKIDIEIMPFTEKMDKWPSPRQYISTF
jgi:DNA-binding Lrp family transcriptional regulator